MYNILTCFLTAFSLAETFLFMAWISCGSHIYYAKQPNSQTEVHHKIIKYALNLKRIENAAFTAAAIDIFKSNLLTSHTTSFASSPAASIKRSILLFNSDCPLLVADSCKGSILPAKLKLRGIAVDCKQSLLWLFFELGRKQWDIEQETRYTQWLIDKNNNQSLLIRKILDKFRQDISIWIHNILYN